MFNILTLTETFHKDSLQHPNLKINSHYLRISEAFSKKCLKQEIQLCSTQIGNSIFEYQVVTEISPMCAENKKKDYSCNPFYGFFHDELLVFDKGSWYLWNLISNWNPVIRRLTIYCSNSSHRKAGFAVLQVVLDRKTDFNESHFESHFYLLLFWIIIVIRSLTQG